VNEANKNLLTRFATAVVMVPLMLAMLYLAPPIVFFLFVLLATVVGAVEFFKMTHPGDSAAQGVGVVTSVGVSLVLYFLLDDPRALLAVALGVPMIAILTPLWRLGDIETAALRTCAGAFGPLWLGGLTLLPRMLKEHGAPRGAGLIILTLAIGWIADTAGYFAGRFLGKHKLYPAVSPKKTVEGAIGAVLGATLSPVVAHFTVLPSLPLVPGIVLGLVAGTVGQLGDLGESLLKRSTGIKDSGAIVPGHGGILDRVDAVLLVSVFVYLFSRFLMA
jgi:phosphatidate cytidylyltransferase